MGRPPHVRFIYLLMSLPIKKKLLSAKKNEPLLPFSTRNEREGIPAALIQQLDVCVEIPQRGVIRSLNVHVSGALLVWEYTRQRLCGAPASSEMSRWGH